MWVTLVHVTIDALFPRVLTQRAIVPAISRRQERLTVGKKFVIRMKVCCKDVVLFLNEIQYFLHVVLRDNTANDDTRTSA